MQGRRALLYTCVYLQGLSLVLSEGGLRDKEEKEPPMEEDVGEADALQGYQWLLRDLPRLPLFDSVRTTTALALQQVWNGLGQSREEVPLPTAPGPISDICPPSPGHPHGNRPPDHQRLPDLPVPAHSGGGAGPTQ